MSMCDFLRKEKDTLVLTSGDSPDDQPMTSSSVKDLMSSSGKDLTSSNDETSTVTSPVAGSKRKAAGVKKPGAEPKSGKRQKTESSSAGKSFFMS